MLLPLPLKNLAEEITYISQHNSAQIKVMLWCAVHQLYAAQPCHCADCKSMQLLQATGLRDWVFI